MLCKTRPCTPIMVVYGPKISEPGLLARDSSINKAVMYRDFASLFIKITKSCVRMCIPSKRQAQNQKPMPPTKLHTDVHHTSSTVQGRIEVCYGLLIPLDTRSLEGFQNVLASAFNMDAVGMPNCCRATNVFGGVAQHLLWISSQTPPRKKQMPEVWTKWSDRCMQSMQQLFTVYKSM